MLDNFILYLRLQPVNAPEKPPRQPNRCGLCKAEGHNKRNCTLNSIRTITVLPAASSVAIVTVNNNTAITREVVEVASTSSTAVTVTDSVAAYNGETHQGGAPLNVIDSILESRGSGDDEDTNLVLHNSSSLGKRKLLQESLTENKLMTKKQWEKEHSRLVGAHFPTSVRLEAFEGKPRDRGQGSNKRNWKRGSCKLCGKHLPNMCESCGVYLCIKNDQNQMNCWKRFHTRPTFSEPDDPPDAIAGEGEEEERKEERKELHSVEDNDESDNLLPTTTIY